MDHSTAKPRYSTIWMITQQCWDSSRVWKLSLKNMVSGLLKVLMPNIKGSSVNPGELIVVAIIFFLCSPILHHKNLNLKNSSPCEETFATSIWSITVSWTSLSNIGGISKYCYHLMAQTTNIAELEKNVLMSFDDVSLLQICWYVSFFSFYPHCSYYSFVAMPTGWCNLSQPTHRAFQEHRLFWPTKSTMVIVLYLPTLLLLSRSLSKCNSQLVKYF